MKSLIERRNLNVQIASNIETLEKERDAKIAKMTSYIMSEYKEKIQAEANKKTRTEILVEVAEMKTIDLKPLYYVENGLLYHRLNPSGQPNKQYIAPKVDGVEHRFCNHEIIHFLNDYRGTQK